MALVAEGIIDPTKAGKYPVILSDALLGKTSSKEVFTGVRYNHRPETVPPFARLKPTPTNKTASYDLSYLEGGGKYTYQGTRNADGSQYVLVFDPKREAFVLHKLDSMFNVNLIRTPNNSDPESLKEEYPHIEGSMPEKASKETKAKKQEKDKASSGGALTMPEKPAKSTPQRRDQSQDEEEDDDDDDDDDGGLILEFPEDDAVPTGDFSPAFNSQSNTGFKVRPFSEIFNADQQDDEDADADAESDDGMEDLMEQFKLPSPVNNPPASESTSRQAPAHEEEEEDDEDEDEEDGGVDLEDDLEDMLEAELEAEFQMERADSESVVSEED